MSFAKWFLHICRTPYDLWLEFPLVMHSKSEQRFQNEHCWPTNLFWETILGSSFHQRYKCFGRERVKGRRFDLCITITSTELYFQCITAVLLFYFGKVRKLYFPFLNVGGLSICWACWWRILFRTFFCLPLQSFSTNHSNQSSLDYTATWPWSEQRPTGGSLVAERAGGAPYVFRPAAGQTSLLGQQPFHTGWHAATAWDLHAAHKAEATHWGTHRRIAAAATAASRHD